MTVEAAAGFMSAGDLEPLATPDALNPVLAHLPAACLQQRGDAAIAIAPVIGGQGNDGSGQRILVGRHGRHVALRAAVLADDPAGVTFREAVLLPDPVHRLPASLGATSFPRRRPPAPASPNKGRRRAGATERSHAPGPSFFWLDRLGGRRTPCASVSHAARRSPPPCMQGLNSYPRLSAPRSGAASAPPAPRSSSDLAACPTPSVLADPLNQLGPKPAGQVKRFRSSVRYLQCESHPHKTDDRRP